MSFSLKFTWCTWDTLRSVLSLGADWRSVSRAYYVGSHIFLEIFFQADILGLFLNSLYLGVSSFLEEQSFTKQERTLSREEFFPCNLNYKISFPAIVSKNAGSKFVKHAAIFMNLSISGSEANIALPGQLGKFRAAGCPSLNIYLFALLMQIGWATSSHNLSYSSHNLGSLVMVEYFSFLIRQHLILQFKTMGSDMVVSSNMIQ